jgi:hypothetical protein
MNRTRTGDAQEKSGMSYVNRSSGNGGQGGGQMVNIPNKRYNIPTADNGPGHRTRLLKVKRFSEAGFNQDSGISWRPRSKMLRSTVFGNGNRTNYPFSNVNMRNFAKLAEAGVMEPDGISSVSGTFPCASPCNTRTQPPQKSGVVTPRIRLGSRQLHWPPVQNSAVSRLTTHLRTRTHPDIAT